MNMIIGEVSKSLLIDWTIFWCVSSDNPGLGEFVKSDIEWSLGRASSFRGHDWQPALKGGCGRILLKKGWLEKVLCQCSNTRWSPGLSLLGEIPFPTEDDDAVIEVTQRFVSSGKRLSSPDRLWKNFSIHWVLDPFKILTASTLRT